jgi:hypothetical protein
MHPSTAPTNRPPPGSAHADPAPSPGWRPAPPPFIDADAPTVIPPPRIQGDR